MMEMKYMFKNCKETWGFETLCICFRGIEHFGMVNWMFKVLSWTICWDFMKVVQDFFSVDVIWMVYDVIKVSF